MLNPVQSESKRQKQFGFDELETQGTDRGKVLIPYPLYQRPYYTNAFPYRTVRHMLGLNTAKRVNGFFPDTLEFAFTYHSSGDRTYWKRYLAFPTEQRFKDYILNCEPLRVDIGSYGYCPPLFWRGMAAKLKKFDETYTEHHASPLVLDVDLKDYDDIRVCECKTKRQFCSDCNTENLDFDSSCKCEWRNLGKICRICWCLATAAMLTIDVILRNYWGFVDFYFVFSGMKGFHCWILDAGTETYTAEERARFMDSFNPWCDKNHTNAKDYAKVRDMDSPRTDVFSKKLDMNVEIIFEQVVLPVGVIFAYENPDTRKLLHDLFQPLTLSDHLFERFESIFTKAAKTDGAILWNNCKRFIDENYELRHAIALKRCITYRYAFPRLDEGVTKKINHPKKSPFSLHPETRKVCVPILPHDFETLVTFSPSTAPFSDEQHRVTEIAQELERDLCVSGQVLLDISLCRGLPRGFQTPQVKEDHEIKNASCAAVAKALLSWLEVEVAKDFILPPWEDSHLQHYDKCRKCTDWTFLENRNTLRYWITEHSWNNENFSKITELALKVAWLHYIGKNCEHLQLSAETLGAVTYFMNEWKLTVD